jgi:hypothetical protein
MFRESTGAMSRCVVTVVALLVVHGTAHADGRRLGVGGRMTAQTGGDLGPHLPGVQARMRVRDRLSFELTFDITRAARVRHDPLPEPFPEDVFPTRTRRYAEYLDLVARYHLLAAERGDLYLLAGPGFSREQINWEDACGSLELNGPISWRPRLVAGFGSEALTELGRKRMLGLGLELRGFALFGEAAVMNAAPPEMPTLGLELSATMTIYL